MSKINHLTIVLSPQIVILVPILCVICVSPLRIFSPWKNIGFIHEVILTIQLFILNRSELTTDFTPTKGADFGSKV